MAIKVNNIVLDIDENIEDVKIKAARKMRIDQSEIKVFRIAKESIDARKKIILSLIMLLLLKWITKVE